MTSKVAPGQEVMVGSLQPAVGHSAAYQALQENNLICDKYLVKNAEALENIILGGWDVSVSCCLESMTLCGCFGCCAHFFTVASGCVRKGTHATGANLFFGSGVHIKLAAYVSVEDKDVRLNQDQIMHGTRAIITVSQGFVGLAMDQGQPLLLPPGLHQWDSATIEFLRVIDLASNVMNLGPYTLLTVDQGYSAITQDNGQQKILEGGRSYMLTHRNWKVQGFISLKMQTDSIGPVTVSTGDNVPLEAAATVNWLIEDPVLAARMATTTIGTSGDSGSKASLAEMRQDVVRQSTASLAAFVGSIRYGVQGNAAMAAQVAGEESATEKVGRQALFDKEHLNNSVGHANEICHRYGVKILSINLVAAKPADKTLMEAMSRGAVAAVAAEQTETAARGAANALLVKSDAQATGAKIRAQGAASALLVTAAAAAEAAELRAKGDSDAERIRAEGSLQAAKLLETSQIAVDLAKLRTAGASIAEGKNAFFFGLQGTDNHSGILGAALCSFAGR